MCSLPCKIAVGTDIAPRVCFNVPVTVGNIIVASLEYCFVGINGWPLHVG